MGILAIQQFRNSVFAEVKEQTQGLAGIGFSGLRGGGGGVGHFRVGFFVFAVSCFCLPGTGDCSRGAGPACGEWDLGGISSGFARWAAARLGPGDVPAGGGELPMP